MRALLLLALAGCVAYDHPPAVEPPPRAAEAIDIVTAMYSELGLELVGGTDGVWVEPAADFPSGRAYLDTGVPIAHCFWAVEYDGAERISDTSLAHELLHCALGGTFADGNAAHDRPEWSDVDRANAELRRRRM